MTTGRRFSLTHRLIAGNWQFVFLLRHVHILRLVAIRRALQPSTTKSIHIHGLLSAIWLSIAALLTIGRTSICFVCNATGVGYNQTAPSLDLNKNSASDGVAVSQSNSLQMDVAICVCSSQREKNKQLPSPADSGASACYTISSNIGRCVITEADLVLIIR